MIIDFRLETFKVEGKRYIICSNHEILFMLFRPLVLYLNKNLIDCMSNCDCIQKASQELRESQMKDDDLLPYFQYLEEGKLPENEQNARRVVLESEKMEVIDGVLHHDSAADQL